MNEEAVALKNAVMRCEKPVRSTIIPHADQRVIVVSRIVFQTYGPDACANWESEIVTIWLDTQLSRSAPVTVKFGIKASSMFASLALAIVFVAGCTEEAPPETPKPAPAAVSPAKGETKPAAPAPTPEKPK